jgi:hypothetical protein
LKLALEKLSISIKNLEDAVDYSVNQQNQHKEKIETLQNAIQTTYTRIDEALKNLEKEDDAKQEDLCLSLL